MRAVLIASAIALSLVSGAAYAQDRGPMNRSATDDCEAEANRLYQMRDLEARMAAKRDHIQKCRAEKRAQGQAPRR
jgi:hypothetical protein